MSAVYRPISIYNNAKISTHAFGACNTQFSSHVILNSSFFTKIAIWTKYFNISHTLFKLNFYGKHTLFSEKSYFISKSSSGITAILCTAYDHYIIIK